MENITFREIQKSEPLDIFKKIETTVDKFKQELQELAVRARIAMNSQMNTLKFEAAYALSVSKKQRLKTMKEVKDVRSELWQESLKKANGNVSEASEIYEKLCVFP